MNDTNTIVRQTLKSAGISASAQRLAVAEYVLFTDQHPSAEEALRHVQKMLPMVSRATVYNTLNLFVKKGLLQSLVLAEGHVVFDPNLAPHHHFVDDATGEISDVPLDCVHVGPVQNLPGIEVRQVQVVLRGKAAGRA